MICLFYEFSRFSKSKSKTKLGTIVLHGMK